LHAVHGIGDDGVLSFWSFTSDGKRSLGKIMALTTASAARPERRWLRLSLRTFLVGIGLIAIVIAWFTTSWRSQRLAIATIERLGGNVGYDYQFVGGDPLGTSIPNARPPGPQWLRRMLGNEPFQQAVQVILVGGRYRDGDLGALEGLPRLQTIALFNCSQITNDGLKHLRRHPELRSLTIYRNQKISDAGLAHLRGLTSLESLHLDGSRVTDAGLDFLLAMDRLQVLDIDGTPVGNDGIVKLKALPRLKQVFVQNSRTTAEGVAELQKHLPKVNVNIGTHPGSFGR
jgi:hypothetical protein